jgi:sarcosine oxidase delta subunit
MNFISLFFFVYGEKSFKYKNIIKYKEKEFSKLKNISTKMNQLIRNQNDNLFHCPHCSYSSKSKFSIQRHLNRKNKCYKVNTNDINTDTDTDLNNLEKEDLINIINYLEKKIKNIYNIISDNNNMVKLSYCHITSGKNQGKVKYIAKGKAVYVDTVKEVPEKKTTRNSKKKKEPAKKVLVKPTKTKSKPKPKPSKSTKTSNDIKGKKKDFMKLEKEFKKTLKLRAKDKKIFIQAEKDDQLNEYLEDSYGSFYYLHTNPDGTLKDEYTHSQLKQKYKNEERQNDIKHFIQLLDEQYERENPIKAPKQLIKLAKFLYENDKPLNKYKKIFKENDKPLDDLYKKIFGN